MTREYKAKLSKAERKAFRSQMWAFRRDPESLTPEERQALEGLFARWLPAATLALASPLLVGLAVLLVDPWGALILAVAGLLVPVGMALAGLGAAAASQRQFVAMGRLQARFLDRVRGIATIVLAGRAEQEAQPAHLSMKR